MRLGRRESVCTYTGSKQVVECATLPKNELYGWTHRLLHTQRSQGTNGPGAVTRRESGVVKVFGVRIHTLRKRRYTEDCASLQLRKATLID